MVHVHAPKGNDETDSGAGAGAGLESEATGKPLCTCNLSPETQDLLKQVFKDIVSVSTLYSVLECFIDILGEFGTVLFHVS